MEAFSLLKYWRSGGGVALAAAAASGGARGDSVANAARATTIVTAVAQTDDECGDCDGDGDGGDDGPFFDLEFAVPDEDDNNGEESKENDGSDGSDGEEDQNDDVESCDSDGEDEGEFKFTLSSASSNDRADPNLALSPSDDLFFKGRLVPIEPSSLVLTESEPNSKTQFSLLKSATRFRVFMLGFKKSKANSNDKPSEKSEANQNGSAGSVASPKQNKQGGEKEEETNKQSKFFTVKFKVEEVPIVSLFTRENSKNGKSSQKQRADDSTTTTTTTATSDEKRFSKEVMNKYLNKVKPLYIRVSKRYGEKLKFSGQLSLGSGPKTPSTAAQAETEAVEAPATNTKGVKQGNLQAGLRVVCKHLGKSRSASAAAVAAAPTAAGGGGCSRRRDDSLLQIQDGIQGAILHCKKSFNASRESESSLLSRSVSDPSHEKSTELCRKSSGGAKSCTD